MPAGGLNQIIIKSEDIYNARKFQLTIHAHGVLKFKYMYALNYVVTNDNVGRRNDPRPCNTGTTSYHSI